MVIALRLFCILVFISSGAYADIYKYTDDTGSVCITNSLDKVPRRYRSTMTVLKEEAPAKKKLLPEVEKRTTDSVPAVSPVIPHKELQQEVLPTASDNRIKYRNTAVVIAGLFALYFLLSRVSRYLGLHRVATVLFLLLVLTGGVYLYGLYVQELRAVFGTLRKDANNIRKNVETREVKTDQMLRQYEGKEQAAGGN